MIELIGNLLATVIVLVICIGGPLAVGGFLWMVFFWDSDRNLNSEDRAFYWFAIVAFVSLLYLGVLGGALGVK